MNVDDATCEVIDTSDTEERELLNAQIPGYHNGVWGRSLLGIETDGSNPSSNTPLLARLQPRTPQHRRVTTSSHSDPSPIFSRLQISPRECGALPSATVTPSTTSIHAISSSTSHPKPPGSAVQLSSPFVSFNAESPRIESDEFFQGPHLDESVFNNLSRPCVQKPSSIPTRESCTGDLNDFMLQSTPGFQPFIAQSNHNYNVISMVKYDNLSSPSLRSSSPPLEFPLSPSPDPLALSPIPFAPRPSQSRPDPKSTPTQLPLHPDDAEKYESETLPTDDKHINRDVIISSPFNNLSTQRRLEDRQPPESGTTGVDQFSFSPFSLYGGSLPHEEPENTRFDNDPEEPSNFLVVDARARTPSPPIQLSSHHISPTPSSPLSPPPPLRMADPDPAPPSPPAIIPPDLGPQVRSYSLRNRSAKQLKPFEYDKRAYKHQFRNMPEAIVKNPAGVVGRRVREQYEGEEGDWEGQSDDESRGEEDAWQRSEERKKRRSEERQRMERADRDLREIGIAFPSDEDDGKPRPPDATSTPTSEGVEKRGKKRKRNVVARGFPLDVEKENHLPHPNSNDGTVDPPPRPRPRPRPRPVFLQRFPTHDLSRSARKRSSRLSSGQMDLDPENGGVEDVELPAQITEAAHESSPIVIDYVENDAESPRGRVRRGRSHESHDSDVQMIDALDASDNSRDERSSSSDQPSEAEVEFTEKDRKRLKAMQRMMPAALANKLMAREKQKPKNKKGRTYQSDSGESDQDAPLQPGHGRKRMVSPGSKDPKLYEIRGDPESESEVERNIRPLAEREIIEVRDSDDDNGSDAERSLEESEIGVDQQDIRTWFAPELECGSDRSAFSRPSMARMRRPDSERDRPRGGDLIDRMLQRTNRVRPRNSGSTRNPEDRVNVRGPRDARSRPALDIVTRDARRHGAGGGRQTRLSFPKKNKPRASGSAGLGDVTADQHHEHHFESRQGRAEKSKKCKKKRALGRSQANLFVNRDGGHNITSGRKRGILQIDNEDDALYEALAPEGFAGPPHSRRHESNSRNSRMNRQDILNKFRGNAGEEPDAFDPHPNGSLKNNHVTLDFDIPNLPVGMTFGSESYMGKGKLGQLILVLKGEIDAPRPQEIIVFEQRIAPDLPASQFSTLLAAVCDNLYDTSLAAVDDPETPLKLKTSEMAMHALCQMVSYRAWGADDMDGKIAAAVSEQTAHLVGRINNRLDLVSADGYVLDPPSFELYWFALELESRTTFAWKKREEAEVDPPVTSKVIAERYATLLVRRLLEFGLDRTLQPLQQEPLEIPSPKFRTMELWACFAHIAPLFGKPDDDASTPSAFWRIVDASMDQQSNKPDSSLDASEHLWRTIFSLCTITQFSVHGLAMSTRRLEQHWPMVSKALGCIRLGANEELDCSKPASTLRKRDKYLRLVTERCLHLDIRHSWSLHDAESVIRELCSIFRSRNFSNLMGETSDFPMFIRDRDEPRFHVDTKVDTAYGVFLKMVIRALKGFKEVNGVTRSQKVNRLLRLAVPVSSMSFTKASPPIGQELSMLYNRYSAVFVAVYVEPTTAHIHHRLQQARRYINFKDADSDSQGASIRTMMNLAILLRHLEQPLDDVLAWASEMLGDLMDNYSLADRGPELSQDEKDKIILSIQLLLGSVRVVIENPTLNRSEPRPAKYPDLALLREDWITHILSSPSLNSNQRTAIEIRKCVQSFLIARSKVIPPPLIPEPSADKVESQDEYGDAGLDMNDPEVLELLNSFEGPPDEKFVADKKAGQIMSTIATKWLYNPVCRHFGQDVNVRFPGKYFLEGDEWVECWVGCASVAVRNNARNWTFYIKLARAACDGIKDNVSCRRRVYMRFLLTMLQLDPTSYTSNEDHFLEVWFETIVSSELTIEHEFNGRLFSVGALRHGLFNALPCTADPETGLVIFTKSEFEPLRQEFIDVAIGNVADNLRVAGPAQAAPYISFIERMLGTLREDFQAMGENDLRRAKHAELCAFVHAAVKRRSNLVDTPTLRDALSRGNL